LSMRFRRHKGDLRAFSSPHYSCFRIRLSGLHPMPPGAALEYNFGVVNEEAERSRRSVGGGDDNWFIQKVIRG
jgi:hypothetical protein